MTARRSSRQSGFTLLELIASTAIMSVLALTLFTAMRVGFKARDRALATVGPARAGEIAVDMVRRDLESALPPRGGLMVQWFIGQLGAEVSGTSAVEFFNVAAPMPEAYTGASAARSAISSGPRATQNVNIMSYGGVQRVQLLLRPATTGIGLSADANGIGGAVLVRRVTRNILAPIDETPEEQIICRNVTAFAIRYFDGLQWTDEWDSVQYGNSLPMAYEVSLEVNGPIDSTVAPGEGNTTTYHASRSFFAPCRDEAALKALGGIR